MLLHQSDLFGGQAAPVGDQVGSAPHGTNDGLGTAPPIHPTMVSRDQGVGHAPAPELRRSGVVGVLEQAGRKALILGGLVVPEHPGKQADHRLHYHQSGQFAAGQDEIADGQLLVDQMVGYPLIHTLVSPTEQGESGLHRRVLLGHLLVEPTARG